MDPPGWLQVILWLCFAYFVLKAGVQFVLRTQVMRMWLLSRFHGVPVPFFELLSMVLRGVPPARVVQPWVLAQEAGLGVTREQLEAHWRAGGDPEAVVGALLVVHGHGLQQSFADICAADLAGEDVLELVHREAAEARFENEE